MSEPLHFQPARFGKLLAHREPSPLERFSEAASFRSVSILMCKTPLRVGWVGTCLNYVRARVVCAAVLATAALMFSATSSRAQTFSTPTDISGGVIGGPPVIAIDPKDNIDVAWWTSEGVFFTRSTDHGKTFANPATVSAGGSDGALQMKVDPSGTIYLLWQRSDLHFLLSRSADGSHFSLPSDLTSTLNLGASNANVPAMALDMSGYIDLVWPEFGSIGAVMFSRSTDGAATFSSPVELGNFGYQAATQIAVGPQGDINILWSELTSDAGGTCSLYLTRSIDSGASFSPAMALTGAGEECDAKLFVDSSDAISVLAFDGGGKYYRSTDGGETFSSAQDILKPTNVWQGQLSANAQANIGAVISSSARHDILFTRSGDNGAKFSEPILISSSHPTLASGGASGGSDPSIIVDSQGNVDVLWQDDFGTPGASDVFFSRSNNGGASFAAPRNVSGSPGTSNPQMAADSTGNIGIVWTAGAERQVLFTRASVSTSGSGFTISASPTSLMALPGGTATAQVTVTATGGFDQIVSLSCGNLPPSAVCSFNPPSITPSGSGSTVGVAITIPPTLSTGGFPFTLNVASPTISQFQDMQISVGLLVGSVTPTAMTIPAGGSATFAVTVASTSFGGQFSLACNAPASVKCTFTPSSTFLPVNGRATSALTVQVLSTPATGSVSKNPTDVFPPLLPFVLRPLLISGLMLLLLSVLGFRLARGGQLGRFGFARTAASTLGGTGLTVALAAIMVSCSGGVDRTKLLGSASGTVGTGGTSGIPGTGGTGGMGGTGGTAGAGGTASGGVTTPGGTSITFPLGVVAQAGGSAVNVGTVTLTVP
jgi:hypothetical protein